MTAPDRVQTAVAHLARAGFTDAGAARTALAAIGMADDAAIVASLAAAADPDLAVASLQRLAEGCDDRAAFLAAVRADGAFRERLLAVLGASTALGEHLIRHPGE